MIEFAPADEEDASFRTATFDQFGRTYVAAAAPTANHSRGFWTVSVHCVEPVGPSPSTTSSVRSRTNPQVPLAGLNDAAVLLARALDERSDFEIRMWSAAQKKVG